MLSLGELLRRLFGIRNTELSYQEQLEALDKKSDSATDMFSKAVKDLVEANEDMEKIQESIELDRVILGEELEEELAELAEQVAQLEKEFADNDKSLVSTTNSLSEKKSRNEKRIQKFSEFL